MIGPKVLGKWGTPTIHSRQRRASILIALRLTSLPTHSRITRLSSMRCASFLPHHSLTRIRLTSLPTHSRITRLPRMRFIFLSYHSLTRIRLTSLPTYPRTIRLSLMSSIRCYSRSRIRQAKAQQKSTRYETHDSNDRYHESLLGYVLSELHVHDIMRRRIAPLGNSLVGYFFSACRANSSNAICILMQFAGRDLPRRNYNATPT